MSSFRVHPSSTVAFLIFVFSFAFEYVFFDSTVVFILECLMPESFRYELLRRSGRDSEILWGFG